MLKFNQLFYSIINESIDNYHLYQQIYDVNDRKRVVYVLIQLLQLLPEDDNVFQLKQDITESYTIDNIKSIIAYLSLNSKSIPYIERENIVINYFYLRRVDYSCDDQIEFQYLNIQSYDTYITSEKFLIIDKRCKTMLNSMISKNDNIIKIFNTVKKYLGKGIVKKYL